MRSPIRSAALGSLVLAVAALVAFPGGVGAARLGIPPAPGADPPGYLALTAPDAVNDTVSIALGDVARFVTLAIENDAAGLRVDIHDPGLYSPTLGAGQLDMNLSPTPVAPATMRYQLFGPDGSGALDALLADMSFGADTAASDRQLINLFDDPRALPGLYHLVCRIVDGVELEQDISAFGVSIPGKSAYALSLTLGEVNDGGATVAEPVRVFPHVVSPTAGSDAVGPLCGLQFVTYDLDASLNGAEPPFASLTTPSGFAYPPDGSSGDARWWNSDVGGIDPGELDSSDHGPWTWSFTDLSQPEDCFSNLTPAVDMNLFAVQVLDYAAAARDFMSWADLPSAPPFIVFNADRPRRLYLPADDDGPPAKEALNHRAAIVSGFPTISLGQTSTLEIVLTLDNPTAYALSSVAGSTHVAPSADITDPVLVSSGGGLGAAINGGDPRRIDITGAVAPGTTGEIRYRVDVTPSAMGPAFLTGDGIDYLAVGRPTLVSYETPFTNAASQVLRQEAQGPVCQLAFEARLPECSAVARLDASALRTCPGTPVRLDASASEVFACAGGVAVYQWSFNGAIVLPYPAADAIDVTPLLNDTWEVAVGCSRDTSTCFDVASITFDLYPAPVVDVGPDRVACLGATVDLDALLSDGAPPYDTFAWSTVPPGQPGDGATTQAISVAPTVDTVYTFTCRDAQGCEGSDSVAIDVRNPSPGLAPDPPALCGGGSVVISALPGFRTYAWTTVPPGAAGDGSTGESVTADQVGVTYTCTVTDADGCPGMQAVTTVASPDPIPGAMNWSLRLAKAATSDLVHSWQDLPDPAGGYRVVALDCADADLDRRCDAPPTRAAMEASVSFVDVPAGAQRSVEPGGLDRVPRLIFYKVRALSPCSLTPGELALEP